jgi:hypothetical protein
MIGHSPITKTQTQKAAIALDAVENIQDFVMAHGALERSAWPQGTPPKNTMLAIPAVYIFSPDGKMIYSGGSDSIEHIHSNLAVLENFPAVSENLLPLEHTPTLASMLDIVPMYKAKSKSILGDGHYLVYVVVTIDPNRVTHTEQKLTELRSRSKDKPIDTLLLKLQQ